MRITSLFSATLIFLLLILAGCNLPGAGGGTETPDITQAYQTVQARLTQSAATAPASPTSASTSTLQPSPSVTVAPSAPTATQSAPQPTQSAKLCDQAAPGVPIDVTIPDDTRMAPGQGFTKTWRLVNTGTCTWTTDYSIALFSGEAMGANSGVQLPNSVASGQSIDVSVDLVAPNTAGTFQGNWKLRNASAQWFGIGPNGNSPFWVKIVVAGTPSASATITPTGTVTVFPTATTAAGPGTLVSGNNNMIPGDQIDLDANQVNSGNPDLAFSGQGNQLTLAPAGAAMIGVYGGGAPSYANCSTATLTNIPLSLGDLNAGMHLCYYTNQGNFGYLRLLSFDATNNNILGFQILTWTQP